MAGKARVGKVGFGGVWHGKAGQVWSDMVRTGELRLGAVR